MNNGSIGIEIILFNDKLFSTLSFLLLLLLSSYVADEKLLEPTFIQRTQLSFNARMMALQRFIQAARKVCLTH